MAIRFLLVSLLALSISQGAGAAEPPVPADHAKSMAASQELFKSQVRGFLEANCLNCHGGERTRSGFDLNSRKTLLEGGDRGPAVIPGKGKESLLVKLVAKQEEPHMPPKEAVPEKVVESLIRWIDLGAAYDKPFDDTAEPKTQSELVVTNKDRNYWAYRRLQPTAVPKVRNTAWPLNDIDRFVLNKLEEKSIEPAADVDKETWLRRVTFDLTGLPPTQEERAEFLRDNSRDAYERVVDRLLASPAYGERWARHWLDPARYGESHGFEHDYYRPFAYHYRDFVIRALNQDMPYDQFVRWQLAGDELAPDDPMALAATGFLGAGVYPTQITTREAERVRYDAMDDMLATTGHTFLAMTIGCARCHDHKYDPIPAKDYYQLLAAFTSTVRSEIEVDLGTPEEQAAMRAWEAKRLGVGSVASGTAVPALNREKPKETRTKIQATTEGRKPMRHHTAVGSIPDFYPNTFLLNRGDTEQKVEQVNLGFPQLFQRQQTDTARWSATPPEGALTSYRRTALANFITDVEHGAGSLAARVVVNRLWHHHFGSGIVSTVNDFGFQAEPPSHPELLEWLAQSLIDNDWSLKAVHRQMVLSRTYRLSAESNPTALQADPDNKLLWHFPRRRLEAEAIRDNLLAVSGMLDRTMYGEGTLNQGMRRRSVYFRIQRSQMIPMLQVFDWPDTLTSAGARPTTVVPTQALLFLNNRHVRGWAEGFARRFQADFENEPKTGVQKAYRIAFCREPNASETDFGTRFVSSRVESGKSIDAALTDYALALMSLNEFIYID